MRGRRWRSAPGVAMVCGALFVACSDPAPPTNAEYCAVVREHLAELATPNIADQAGIERVLTTYRDITSNAPIAIEKEWATMVATLETASTVNPNDPLSMQKAADTARVAQPSATRISDYTSKLCGVAVGAPLPTAPPSSTAGTTTTTTG